MAWWVHGAVSAGKRGIVRAGGSASRIIGDQGTIDPGGEERASRSPGANRYGGHRWGMCMVPVGLRACKLFHHWGGIRQCFPQEYTNGITEGCRPWLSRCWDRGIGLFRTLRSGWTGSRHRWSPQCPELGDRGGGCSLQGGIAGLRRN